MQAPYWFGVQATRESFQVNPERCLPLCGMNASCDVKVTFGNPICWINLPGKTSIINYFGNCNNIGNRTVIRHR
jgi:hypothetical protein